MATSSPQIEITLFRGSDEPGHFVWSPFVTKVEFRLRTSNTSYTRAIGAAASGPKGKIPYLDLTMPGQPTLHLADSTLILKSLVESNLINDVNSALSPAQKGIDLAIRALFEEKLYFLQAHERWIVNFETMRDHILAAVPLPQRLAVGEHVKGEITRKLDLQGVGRFTEPEKRAAIRDIWEGLSGLLEASKANVGDGGVFWVLGGPLPSEADATVFGFAASVLISEASPQSMELVKREFPVVVEYAKRVQARWFGDYALPL
ncbi:hypothetical protein CC80DRAFT_437556 [Byssothecium circinans]|uniref:Thioredoxin-like fold domain-containing protein n=1 Tax=Byssothecium circinans TaxID=147558 RepID=A0A6A5U878_9PLEO|nr:hypothetical protein CC80DRAFT_437556 [Byssothecium circinans]